MLIPLPSKAAARLTSQWPQVKLYHSPAPDMVIVDLPETLPIPSAPLRPGLGDRLAALLHLLGITAAMVLLQRRGLLPADCGCASRQAHLNALTPRLKSLLCPSPSDLVLASIYLLLALSVLLL